MSRLRCGPRRRWTPWRRGPEAATKRMSGPATPKQRRSCWRCPLPIGGCCRRWPSADDQVLGPCVLRRSPTRGGAIRRRHLEVRATGTGRTGPDGATKWLVTLIQPPAFCPRHHPSGCPRFAVCSPTRQRPFTSTCRQFSHAAPRCDAPLTPCWTLAPFAPHAAFSQQSAPFPRSLVWSGSRLRPSPSRTGGGRA